MGTIAVRETLSAEQRIARDIRALLAWIAFVLTALFIGAAYLGGVGLRFW